MTDTSNPLTKNSTIEDPVVRRDLHASDEDLNKESANVIRERRRLGLDGLVGCLQAVIINTEPNLQLDAANELIRYSGLQFHEAFKDDLYRTYVLKVPGNEKFRSADFLIRSRITSKNPFRKVNDSIRTQELLNTRLETFVFETPDIKKYVSLQREANVEFLSEIVDFGNYYFIQTLPSKFTGNSIGLIEWKAERGIYSSPMSQSLECKIDKPNSSDYQHLKNILWLDHAATRVRAQDRNHAILEFMQLTNYNFDFAIYVKSLNSITSVARLSTTDFAMVFTSGIAPYVGPEISGPTEKFISNFGARVHHIAFQTEEIESTVAALERDGMKFLLPLVGSPEEGLKQIFSETSRNTLLVIEYIHRYGDFNGFFTKSNVASLTAATAKQ